jgi:comEA protein
MNEREKVVVIFLASVFVVGAGLSFFKALKQPRTELTVQYVAGEKLTEQVLDINQATAEQLEALPGIGPVIAHRIVDYREKHGLFKSVDELLNVNGIGPKRLAAIKDFVVCNQP